MFTLGYIPLIAIFAYIVVILALKGIIFSLYIRAKDEQNGKNSENKNNKEKASKILNIKSPLRKATDFAFGLNNPGYRIASSVLDRVNSSKEQYSKEQINWAKNIVTQYNDWEKNSKFYEKEANKWAGFISTQKAIKNKSSIVEFSQH